MLKGQDLANALVETDYVKAVQLAFELKRPMKLLDVFREMFRFVGGVLRVYLFELEDCGFSEWGNGELFAACSKSI